MGASTNVASFLNSIDIFISPSRTESFPNALLEAVATGTYCIATDTGDSSYILSSFGILISPDFNPEEFVNAISIAIKKIPLRQTVRDKMHKHIKKHFSNDNFKSNYRSIEDLIL